MAAPKRTSSQITDNRRVITTLYLQGITQVEIGKRLGMSQPMVSYDLAAIQRVWAQHTAFDLDAAKRKELARIDVLERTYWEAWEDSKGQHEVTTTQIDEWEVPAKGHKTASIRRELLNGNAAYLAGVMACIEKRCKLLGLDAPVKQALVGDVLLRVVYDDEKLDLVPYRNNDNSRIVDGNRPALEAGLP